MTHTTDDVRNGDRPRVHSEDYFGDARDFWWNGDFLALIARRLDLASARMVLDVGCGFGHWSRALGATLAPEARLFGVDREATSLKEATLRTSRTPLGARASFRLGDALALPFHDGVFDLVTCQTLLIHLADPAGALREMMRVLAPGGRVLVVEPDNLATSIGHDARENGFEHREVVDLFRFQLLCEAGKRALGEGDNSLAVRLPSLLVEAGFGALESFQGDRPALLAPPYESPAQRALIAETTQFLEEGHALWRRPDTERYFLAGGGEREELPKLWALATEHRRRVLVAIKAGRYCSSGGHVTTLMTGTKPR